MYRGVPVAYLEMATPGKQKKVIVRSRPFWHENAHKVPKSKSHKRFLVRMQLSPFCESRRTSHGASRFGARGVCPGRKKTRRVLRPGIGGMRGPLYGLNGYGCVIRFFKKKGSTFSLFWSFFVFCSCECRDFLIQNSAFFFLSFLSAVAKRFVFGIPTR